MKRYRLVFAMDECIDNKHITEVIKGVQIQINEEDLDEFDKLSKDEQNANVLSYLLQKMINEIKQQ